MLITKKIHNKKVEKGLSLIEASMVLALSAIVISGVMVYYQSASENNKIQTTMTEVMGAIATVNTLYATNADYSTISHELLLGASGIPEKFKDKTAKKIRTPFTGELQLAPVASDKLKYTLSLTDLPVSACTSLAVMDLGTSMEKVEVGAVAVTGNPIEAAKACSGSPGGKATVKFTLK